MLTGFLALLWTGAAVDWTYCQPGDACWPTPAEMQALSSSLSEGLRTVEWPEDENVPFKAPPPIFSQGLQPLYGLGTKYAISGPKDGLKPTYADYNGTIAIWDCNLATTENRQICFSSVRNNPNPEMQPAFVVFALNAEDVSKAVKFAVDHNLCMAVAGSGHDFLNRHSCTNGMMIRTTLIKGITFKDDPDRPGEKNAVVGSGVLFGELQKEAAEIGAAVASGWVHTVGVAGWSMGGGHGPMANLVGLGTDQIVEVKIVTADGELVTANKDENYDLWKALRGAGGSSLGIATEFTLRTHKLPRGGISNFKFEAEGDNCGFKFWKNGRKFRSKMIERYLKWASTTGPRWSGNSFIIITEGPDENSLEHGLTHCGSDWKISFDYYFYGPRSAGWPKWRQLQKMMRFLWKPESKSTSWDNMYLASKPSLEELQLPSPSLNIIPSFFTPLGTPSVLVEREKVESGLFGQKVMESIDYCIENKAWAALQIYQDISGSPDSPKSSDVSISSALRHGMIHYLGPMSADQTGIVASIYKDLGDHSYQNECAYVMPDWRNRLWGQDVYNYLLGIKEKYDPNAAFWCRHCVGDNSDGQEPTFQASSEEEGGEEPVCCQAVTASCEACKQEISEEQFCTDNPGFSGCGITKHTSKKMNSDRGGYGSRGNFFEKHLCPEKCRRRKFSAECMACKENITVEKYCDKNPDTEGCSEVSQLGMPSGAFGEATDTKPRAQRSGLKEDLVSLLRELRGQL